MNSSDPTSELAYRFEYADGSAFEVYADGRAFLDLCERGKEEKFGKVDNRIPALIGMAAKPRQDRIDELTKQLVMAKAALQRIASFGNENDWRAEHQVAKGALTGDRQIDRDRLWKIIAQQIACESDCQKWPNGCGCAQNAADRVLSALTDDLSAPETKQSIGFREG